MYKIYIIEACLLRERDSQTSIWAYTPVIIMINILYVCEINILCDWSRRNVSYHIRFIKTNSHLLKVIERWNNYFWVMWKSCHGRVLNDIGVYLFTDLHCCKLAADMQCEQACQDSLRRKFDSDVEAVDSLEGRGCGPPSLDVSKFRFNKIYLQWLTQ